MVRAGSLQRSERPPRPGAWIVPPAVTVIGAVVALLLVSSEQRVAVAWCAVVTTALVAALSAEAARRGMALAALKEQLATERAARRKEAHHLAWKIFPVVLDKVQDGASPSEVAPRDHSELSSDPEIGASYYTALFKSGIAVQEREHAKDSANRAIVNISCRIQSEIHRLQDDINKMQYRHGGPEILGDLMHLEHGINVTGRFAVSLAVLGGGAPMRRWQRPISLYDVMRAGSAPIQEYLRVEQHHVAEVAVIGPAAESVILVLSELLDNACRYSPPSTSVVMNTEEVAAGVEISIEDKGMGLTEESRKHAEFLMKQAADGLDLSDLGETARVGLRVASILSNRFGLRLTLRPSTGNGVRAVVFVPQELLTQLPEPKYPIPGMRPKPHPVMAPGLARPVDEDEEIEYERNENGLPQRHRNRAFDNPRRAAATQAARQQPAPAPAPDPVDARDRAAGKPARQVESGLWVSDFFAGLAAADGGHPSGTDHSSADQPTGKDLRK
ncbi:hypothetical protein SUDANB171_04366 [Streptomyces sp. enrichment culture]|jgi:signal transduction histidine kinase